MTSGGLYFFWLGADADPDTAEPEYDRFHCPICHYTDTGKPFTCGNGGCPLGGDL